MPSARGATRPALLVTTVCLAVLMVGVLSPAAEAAATDPRGAQVSASLTDDSGGVALFDGTAPITPLHPQVACIAIGASGATPTDQVVMSAQHLTGSWASALVLRVELGTGGRAGDCSRFSGTTVWEGPLSGLAASTGVALGWRPADTPVRSLRLTARILGTTSGPGRVQADLVWALAASSSTADGATDPASNPSATRSATSPSPSPSPSLTATGSTAASSTAMTGPPISTTAGGDAPDLTIEGGPGVGAGGWTDRLADTILGVLRSPQYPLIALALALGFLLVQEQLDRRDPKLALAAQRQRDNELVFRARWLL